MEGIRAFYEGNLEERVFDGTRRELAVVAGFTEGRSPRMGIGVIDASHSIINFMGLMQPFDPISTYRGALLADSLEILDVEILERCLYAGRRTPVLGSENLVAEVTEMFDPAKKKTVFEKVCPDLDELLMTLREEGVEIDTETIFQDKYLGLIDDEGIGVFNTIQDHIDRELILQGLGNKYAEAIDYFAAEKYAGKVWDKVKAAFAKEDRQEHIDTADEYCARVESMIENRFPKLKARCDDLLTEVASAPRRIPPREHPTPQDDTAHLFVEKAFLASKELMQLPFDKTAIHYRMRLYVEHIRSLAVSLSVFSSIYMVSEDAEFHPETKRKYLRICNASKELLRDLNRAVQNDMRGIYSMNPLER